MNRFIASFLGCLIFIISSFGQGAITKKDFDNNKKVSVLVMMQQQPDLSIAKQIVDKSSKSLFVFNELNRVAKQTQKDIIKHLKAYNIYHQSFIVVNALEVEADYDTYLFLKNRKEVKYVFKNVPRPMLDHFEDRNQSISPRMAVPTWGITNIQADSLWRLGYKGQNVVVGGQDTGYEWFLPQIKQRYRGYINETSAVHSYNWHDAIRVKTPLNLDSANTCGYDVKVPCDDNSHGTHTMGTMVGNDTVEQIGVAPFAKWIGCRNMDRGDGTPSTYIECFNWFLAPTDTANANPNPLLAPDVIANSWGCPASEGCTDSTDIIMRQAIVNLKLAGVVVVVSAGNSGPNCKTVNNPAGYFNESFSVGAHASTNVIAGFSSRGASSKDTTWIKPNVSAPGVGVRSITKSGAMASYSGTSMAGPHVAGAVALLISALPQLKGQVDLIENIMELSAIPTTAEKDCNGVAATAHPNNTYGYGRLNCVRMLNIAKNTLALNTIDENEKEINVYPNPATSQVIVDGDFLKDEKTKTFSLYDITGRRIFYKSQISNLIDLGQNLQNGIYSLLVRSGNLYGSKKLIINK